MGLFFLQKQKEVKTLFFDALHGLFLTRFCESQNLTTIKRSRGSILEIKSGFCETSDKDKTKVYRGSELKQSPILAHPTGCKALAEAKKTNAPN